MISPMKATTLTVVPVSQSAQTAPTSASGMVNRMTNGMHQRFELGGHHQVDEEHGHRQREQHRVERFLHLGALAREMLAKMPGASGVAEMICRTSSVAEARSP
jgi:hypothetical protein